MGTELLPVSDLTVHYGAIQALRGISFEVAQGEIIALIWIQWGREDHNAPCHFQHH